MWERPSVFIRLYTNSRHGRMYWKLGMPLFYGLTESCLRVCAQTNIKDQLYKEIQLAGVDQYYNFIA